MAFNHRIGFAATPAFALPALRGLVEAGCRPRVVYTQPDRPAGRGRQPRPSPVKQYAAEQGIHIEQPASLREPDAQQTLREYALDVLIVVAYGLILPESVLAAPRRGCINVHASLLPRWRGAAPIQRALLAADEETGICLMQMEKGLDEGPVFERSILPIDARATAATLHDQLAELGARRLLAQLDGILNGTLQSTPQSELSGEVCYAEKIDKREAKIDWRASALVIDRQIRAFDPNPIAYTTLPDEHAATSARIKIHCAEPLLGVSANTAMPGTIIDQPDDGITVACGHGLLQIRRLQMAGKKPIAAAEFNRAYAVTGRQLGDR